MSTTWVIIIIVLVLGVVIGNITLLKYSARFKFPTPLNLMMIVTTIQTRAVKARVHPLKTMTKTKIKTATPQ